MILAGRMKTEQQKIFSSPDAQLKMSDDVVCCNFMLQKINLNLHANSKDLDQI